MFKDGVGRDIKMTIADKDLVRLYDEYSKCKTVRGRTETRVKIKNRLNFLKMDRGDMKVEDIFKDIIKDLANNDYTSFNAYLESKFSTVTSENETYIGKTSVDMLSVYIKQERADVLQRMLMILEDSAESKFGKDIDYAIFMMDELLPERFGVELWAYKKPQEKN